jgi:hypothetical protein
MANLTNNEEVAVMAGIFTIGATAVYISTQTWMPLGFRMTLAGILGVIAFVGGTFWAAFVNAKGNPAAVPLPPQVQASTQTNSAVSASERASSDKQAETKS